LPSGDPEKLLKLAPATCKWKTKTQKIYVRIKNKTLQISDEFTIFTDLRLFSSQICQ